MTKSENVKKYATEIKRLIEEAKKDGVDIQPYEKKIQNGDSGLIVERGIAVFISAVKAECVPTWKLANASKIKPRDIVCISLKALYDEGFRDLQFSPRIEYTNEDGQEYYDLWIGNNHVLCDGEQVHVEYADSVYVLVKAVESNASIFFSVDEFNIATRKRE